MGNAARGEPSPFPEDDHPEQEISRPEVDEDACHEVDDLWFAIFARLLERKKRRDPSRQ